MKQRVLAAGLSLPLSFAALVPFATLLPVVSASAPGGQDQPETKLVEEVQFTGNRRIPDDSVRLWVQTREGDPFSKDLVARDLRTILAQGYFEDAKVFTEDGPRGGLVVLFELKEFPVILDIDYPGMKSVSQSDVLE